ncbi:MAG: hypothetical protein HY820_41835 [Acidobacteria bacterium]|nr:hypothetical protein [Acidobacteriota bacterium]
MAEVAVMDDASQNSTYELALGYKSDSSQVDKLHVVRHPEKQGLRGQSEGRLSLLYRPRF